MLYCRIPVAIVLNTRFIPQLRRLVAGFTLRKPGLNPRSDHVGFDVENVAIGHVPPPPSTSVCRVSSDPTDCSTFVSLPYWHHTVFTPTASLNSANLFFSTPTQYLLDKIEISFT
jgi:hypothetical protein